MITQRTNSPIDTTPVNRYCASDKRGAEPYLNDKIQKGHVHQAQIKISEIFSASQFPGCKR